MTGKPESVAAMATDTQTGESLLQRALDQILAFAVVLTPDGVVVEANRAALEAARLTASDIVAKPFWDCGLWSWSPEVRKQIRETIARAARGERVRCDADARTTDGALMMIDLQVVPLRSADGRIAHLAAAGTDVTRRKRTEVELREASDIAGLGRWEFDVATRSIVWSDEVYRIFGRDPRLGPPTFEELRELLHPEDLPKLDALVARALSEGKDFDAEWRALRPDGTYRWKRTWARVYRSPAGDVARLVGTDIDITKRKRVEEALRASEAEFRAIFEMAGRGKAQVDPQTYRFVRVNRAFCEITGYSAQELLARTFKDITHPDDVAADIAAMEKLARGELATHDREKRYIRKDGSVIWGQLNVVMLRDRDGRPTSAVSVLEDITQRKQTEQSFKLLVQEVDHRAKNLLTLIQAMMRQTRADSVPEFVERMQGRIGALARVQAQLAANSWQNADLRRLIGEELSPFATSGERLSLSGPAVEVGAAAAQALAMVMHELATNAAKYGALSTRGGRVAVAWAWDRGTDLVISWTETGGPPVAKPDREGFGTRVVSLSIERQLDGAVEVDWRREGLACRLRLPVRMLLDGAEAVPQNRARA